MLLSTMRHLKLRPFTARVFHHTFVLLLLTHSCGGESKVTSPDHPIVALVGEDIILPCHLEPAMDASELTVEWTRPDLNPRFVHVWRDGVELENKKHQFYKGRTFLFTEELKHGNISLNISKVRISDKGTYKCFIPGLSRSSLVKLVVGSVSSPVIEMDNNTRGVLQCESTGWYPEPEVFWLDAEGNLLPAGPTETVRGPDDLYTVSSRVTVEKRHSNSFTCRVQQNHINQTRETLIHVSDDFFEVQSSFVAPIIIGLAVCIVFISAAVVILWKWRQKKTNNKQDEEKKKKKSTSDDPEHQDLMRGGRNKKEEATLNQDKGRENKTLTLKPVKNSEEIPCKDLLKRENGQKYREGTDTTYVGNQREISMQGEASEKQDVKKLSSDGKESLVQKRIEEFQNPPQDTKPRGEDKELTQDTKMLKNDATVSKNIEIFSAQSCESEKKPQAESQRAQGTKKTDTSVHTVAHGHFVRS
ncbi:butyrophilin subfamily 3 member A2-like [Pagrus major]|uniref:butyrophilin subfamily 3 member A2-like n=1 Tax=Pagrus major TaxID=143350 RepID=UPI003CC8768B